MSLVIYHVRKKETNNILNMTSKFQRAVLIFGKPCRNFTANY